MDYGAIFKQALSKLEELQNQYVAETRKISDTGREISQLAKVLADLGPLANQSVILSDVVTELLPSFQQVEELEVGITDKIRFVLQSQHPAALQPTEVRTHLEQAKFDLAKYSNPMATIHMVLKRIVEQNQATTKPSPDGKTAYQWIAPVPAPQVAATSTAKPAVPPAPAAKPVAPPAVLPAVSVPPATVAPAGVLKK